MINYILLFIFTFILLLCLISYYYRLRPKIISSSNFPDIQQLTQYKKTFIDELASYSQAHNWINYSTWETASHYDAIKNSGSYLNLNINNPLWNGYIFRLNKNIVVDNSYAAPKTTLLLLNISRVVNVVMTCLEAGFSAQITAIKNPLGYIYRAFVPIYIAEKTYGPKPTLIKNWNTPNYVMGNVRGWHTVIKKNPNDLSINHIVGVNIAGNSINLIDTDKNNEIVIFDGRLDYQIWNKTDYDSFILVIDVLQ